MLEFDYELAQLAVATGSGRIITRTRMSVKINRWNRSKSKYNDNTFLMHGEIITPREGPNMTGSWTKKGKFYNNGSDSDFDLFIEELC
jgi:hypothetical protein